MTYEDAMLYERITGRKVPVPLSPDEVPAPDEAHMLRYTALGRLVTNPDFATFLEFARERALGVLDGAKASKTTEIELRAAKCQHEVVAELGAMVMEFLRQTEEWQSARQKWLEDREKTNNTTRQ